MYVLSFGSYNIKKTFNILTGTVNAWQDHFQPILSPVITHIYPMEQCHTGCLRKSTLYQIIDILRVVIHNNAIFSDIINTTLYLIVSEVSTPYVICN